MNKTASDVCSSDDVRDPGAADTRDPDLLHARQGIADRGQDLRGRAARRQDLNGSPRLFTYAEILSSSRAAATTRAG